MSDKEQTTLDDRSWAEKVGVKASIPETEIKSWALEGHGHTFRFSRKEEAERFASTSPTPLTVTPSREEPRDQLAWRGAGGSAFGSQDGLMPPPFKGAQETSGFVWLVGKGAEGVQTKPKSWEIDGVNFTTKVEADFYLYRAPSTKGNILPSDQEPTFQYIWQEVWGDGVSSGGQLPPYGASVEMRELTSPALEVTTEPQCKGWTWGEGARVFKTKAEAELSWKHVQVAYPTPATPARPLRECVEEPTHQLQWVGEDGFSYGSRDGLLPSGSFSMVPLNTPSLRQARSKGPISWGWVGPRGDSYRFETKAEAERFYYQCTKGYQAKYPLEVKEGQASNCQLRWLEGDVEYGSKEGLMPPPGVIVLTDIWDSTRLSYVRPTPEGIKPEDLKVYPAYLAAANCSDRELAQKLGGHGTTNDLLVQAIKEALSGKDVLYIVSNMYYADVITRRIAEVIEGRASQNRITLGSGSSIQVVSVGQLNHLGRSGLLQGRRGSHFIDHYAQVHTRLSSGALRDLEMFSTGFTQPKATNPSSWVAGKMAKSGFIFKTEAEAERWSGPGGWVRVSDLDHDTQLHWWWEGQLYGSRDGLLPPDGVEFHTVRLSAPEVGAVYVKEGESWGFSLGGMVFAFSTKEEAALAFRLKDAQVEAFQWVKPTHRAIWKDAKGKWRTITYDGMPSDAVEWSWAPLSVPVAKLGVVEAVSPDFPLDTAVPENSSNGLLLVLGALLGVSTLVNLGSRKTTRYEGAFEAPALEVEVLDVEVSAPQGEQYVR